MPSNLCVVKIITRVLGSKMFSYCSYAAVLLRCCISDIDRSTSNIWDSVPKVNRNCKNLLSALRHNGQRCGSIPQEHTRSLRCRKFTHTFLWLGWHLSLSDKFGTWKWVVHILFVVQFNLLCIGSTSSYLCDLFLPEVSLLIHYSRT
jgi:hypothetical protein